jgi:hypothetical protein
MHSNLNNDPSIAVSHTSIHVWMGTHVCLLGVVFRKITDRK